MKKAKYVSLGLIAVLSCYLLATAVFVRFLDARAGLNLPTRTPGPTFTASPAPAVAVVPVAPPTVSPAQVSPTPTLRPSQRQRQRQRRRPRRRSRPSRPRKSWRRAALISGAAPAPTTR